MELDGKACDGVGQSSLMCWCLLDETVAQMLVADSSYREKDFRKQLSETVKAMLKMRVIPVSNESDAIGTRKAPYKLSCSTGLHTGPRSDPNSKIIHTYIKEKYQDEIRFGEKSKLRRGDMTAKFKAAVSAAYGGIPDIINL